MTPNAQPAVPQGDGDLEEIVPRLLPVGYLVGGKYKIHRTLGAGGNGAVYEGEHATVGHRVAIKIVHASLAGRDDIMSRFKHEARVCGTLRHPNIGQVYDIGTLEDGAPYMVMELQVGRSLAEVIEEAELPIPAILNLTQQLLSALGAAHHADVVHRDVKPDNVMIVRDQGGDAVVKLVDFGISKAITRKRGDTRNTEEGLIVGSPDYMSPEQLRGEDVDLRTDIYSTGVLLYELITRRLPFEEELIPDLMVAVLRDPITPVREHRPSCPPELERVVMKALSRKREDRYTSTGEMSRDLATAQQSAESAAASLRRLSERPGAPSQTLPQRKRRTVDAQTLEFHRHKTVPTLDIPGTGRRNQRVAMGLVAVVVLIGSWIALRPQPRIVATEIAPAPAATDVPTVDAPPDVAPPVVEAAPTPDAPPTAIPDAPAPEVEAAPVEAVDVSAAPQPPSPSATRVRTKERQPRAKATVEPETSPQSAPPAASEPSLQELQRRAGSAVIQGQTALARDLYRQVVARNPHAATAWRGLAVTASRLGAHAEAERALARYLALRPYATDGARIRAQVEKAR